MSLHALAGHMAAKGRGSDSMLVHMTPEEVQSLQVLALKGGGTLTINPETGLPEANFLKKMLPMIAGAALNFFAPGVGTAVGGMFGLGAAAGTGLAVGGISALATGSLSRGLMAGLGAYGGASLAGSLANAGTGALSSEAANAALAEAGVTDALSPAADEVAQRAIGERLASATPYDKLATGFKAVTDSPAAFGNFAKNNIGAGLAAISAINADEGVQTTTKRPDTGMIRNYTFDPYGQTYTSAGNYPASEYKGMAQGGIVALAAGGTPSYFAANPDVAAAFKENPLGLTAEQFAQTHYEKFGQNEQRAAPGAPQSVAPTPSVSDEGIRGYLAARPGLSDIAIQQAMDQYRVSPEQMARATGVGFADVQDRYELAKDINAFSQTSPNLTDLQWAQYAVARDPDAFDPASMAELSRATGVPLDQVMQRYSAVQHGLLVPEGDSAAAQKYLQENKDVFDWTRSQEGRDYMRAHALTADDIAYTHFNRYGAGEGRTWGALTPAPTAEPGIVGISAPAGTTLPGGVSGGGNTVLNPDGTITTTPNIPGRPEGGFTGMGQVKDVYTQGGGSTGYVNRAPTTMEEFNQRFNKQTGDSLAAYDYLMGKGANNNAYPTKSGVEQIMRPYSEVTTGIPAAEGRPTQKYIFDAATKRYVENPNYRPLSYNSKGERVVGLTPTEVLTGLAPFKDGKNDAGLFDFVTQNNISEAQLAAALGISLAEARARLAAAKKTSTAATNAAANVQTGGDSYSDGSYSGGGGGYDSSAVGTGEFSGMTSADMDAAGMSSYAYGGTTRMALGGLGALAGGGSASQYNLGSYSDGGRLLRGPGDGVSDSIPATIGGKQPARLADGEFVVPARIVSELGNGSTEAGARKLYAMMDRVQKARGKTTGKKRVAANTRADKYLPA